MGLASLLKQSGSPRASGDGRQNVLIMVFDAWSAYHLSLHGYPRETMPNLNRHLDRAIVYHKHYAPADFTTPGTASLLTGTMPWTHRAFQFNGPVTDLAARNNVFRAFQGYHRIAYSHNPAANRVLRQFRGDLDEFVPQSRLFLTGYPATAAIFGADVDLADVAGSRVLSPGKQGSAYSLFLSRFYDQVQHRQLAAYEAGFPLGVPGIESGPHFLLEDAIDWLEARLPRLPQPYLGYFHFLPPHDPSAAPQGLHRHFVGDGYMPPEKPMDVFAQHLVYPQEFSLMRRQYDEFLLYVDREFGRLFDFLESTGALDNTWIVLTSDHGELFERGLRGHQTPMLYEPLIRIPLLIFEPGRRTRSDIHSPTSAIDLLPTLLHLTGDPAAAWAEGAVLPPFVGPPASRMLYSLHARLNPPNESLTHATAVLINDRYKLLYFFGYEELGAGGERIELYDLLSDREELQNLFPERRKLALEQLDILKAKLAEVNQPYS
jgi:arylsulfatase A-like enzyme